MLVVVALREAGRGVAIDAPRRALPRRAVGARALDVDGATTVATLVEPHGLALLERV